MLSFACTPFVTVEEFLASDCACSLDPIEDEILIEALIDQASDMLSLLSGGRITGVCSDKVYPVGTQDCWVPMLWEGRVPVNGVKLRGPNTNVTNVTIDGVVVPPAEYVVNRDPAGYSVLTRIGGYWPTINDPYALGTGYEWSIEFTFGRLPDLITKIATMELACELISFTKTGRTNLGPGVTSANVQGVSISLRDQAESLREGSEFVPAVARFLGIYAPEGRARSNVYSPDTDGDYTFLRK